MNKKRNKKIFTVLSLTPLYMFTFVFIVFPILYMVFLSFMEKSRVWGFDLSFTLNNYIQVLEPVYMKAFIESFKLALISTAIIALIGYPFAYFMAQLSAKWKRRVMLLMMVPFWTSSLLRLYGWIIVFSSNGLLDQALLNLHLTKEPLRLLYSYQAVTFGMVYALLPFMILSVYSSVEKMDWNLRDASMDLYANHLKTFFAVTFPMTMPGLLSGIILTFIPSMGLFFISNLLGGNKIVLIGNLIEMQMTKGRNQPFAAALSVILLLFTSIMIGFYAKLFHKKDLEGII